MNDYQSNNNNNKHILLLLKTEWRRGWRKSFKKINEIVFIHKCSSALRRWRWRVFVLAPRVIWTFVGFVFFTFCVFRKALSVKERNHMSMLSKYIPQISWLFLLLRHPLLLFCCCWWSVGMQHTYAAWRYLEKNTKRITTTLMLLLICVLPLKWCNSMFVVCSYICMHVHVYPVCICLSLFTHATGGKCCTQSAFSCCSPPTSLPASLMLYTLCGCTLYFYHYFWLFLLSLFGCEICCCLPFSI